AQDALQALNRGPGRGLRPTPSMAFAESRPARRRPRLAHGAAAPAEQPQQQPAQSLRPLHACGPLQGRHALVPVAVEVVDHFYYSSPTSGFRLRRYVDTVSAA